MDFDSYSDEVMTFDTWYNYGSDDFNNYLKLFYSSDYLGLGDPSGYTWTELTYTQPAGSATWTPSGDIDLSTVIGTSVYIAFKYRYEVGNYRWWEVDNLSIITVGELDPPINITISTTANAIAGTDVTITWNAVAGATSYNVYRTDDPYATFPDDWTAYTGIVGTAWNYTSQSVAKFYQVTASSLAGSTDVIGKDKGEDHSIKGTHVEKVRK